MDNSGKAPRKAALYGCSAAIGLIGALASSTACAQQTPAIPDEAATSAPAVKDGSSPTPGEQIVVTGSRIRRPNLASAVPITSISGQQFFEQSNTNVGDTLNNLPQLRSTFAQQNPGLGIGIAGLNLLDLRGLGTARTLVLVNGRRHVPADILNNAVSPDVNTIPNDLIERVDIVTGSQSATYGSDAIAGVVNFILRRDFNGFQVRGQAGVSTAGFGGNQYVSAMYGKNFAEGRGNITLHGEYANQRRIFGSDIPAFARADGLAVIDVDPAGLPNGSDGFPDRAYVRDIRSASINRFGLVPVTQPTANPLCGMGIGATNGAPGTTGGTPFNCTYVFTDAGQLTPQTGTRLGQGVIGTILGGNGQTGREGKLLSVLPGQQRYNFNLLAHFTVSDAFEPFIEAKWNRIHTRGSNAGPSFIQGTFTQFDIRERVRLDNPFLSATDRTTITNALLTSGCNPSLSLACSAARSTRATIGATNVAGVTSQGISGALSASDIALINAGSYRFVNSRQLADSGIRDEDFRRDTYRIVGGVRGNFNNDWNYELSVNYGKFKERTITYGYLDRQKFMLSLDAGRNPLTGQIQCRSQFDPTAAVAFAGSNARLTSDIAGCVPYNPFGGADNSAAAKYFTYNALNEASLSQLDVSGFVGGNLSQLFELPGGPVAFSLGGEYRREKAKYSNDPFVDAGYTNAVAIGQFNPPAFEVREAFGEVRVPLLKDMFLIKDLSLNAAGRVSDYKGLQGTVWTYNYGAEYSPVADIRFRVGYGKAVRAPNVSETGFPAVSSFAPGFLDPCAQGQIANNPNRQANCTADLGSLLAGLPNTSYSLPIISGSNADLKPETSKSLTIGAVIQPRWVPGLSISVDYYRIKVSNVIVSLAAQTIANSCYDQPSLSNPFCAVFARNKTTGVVGSANPGQILDNTLLSAPLNFAKRVREGIDVTVAYRTQIASNVRLDTNLIYTHGLKSSNYENTTLPDFENRLLSELGDPKNEFRLDADLSVGLVTFGYRMHYIGPMFVNAYEDFNALPSACSSGVCPPNNSDYADIHTYPSVFYHDVRLSFNLKDFGGFGKDFELYFGVDNILNKQPPLGATATGAGALAGSNAAIYDIRGRTLYSGVRARF